MQFEVVTGRQSDPLPEVVLVPVFEDEAPDETHPDRTRFWPASACEAVRNSNPSGEAGTTQIHTHGTSPEAQAVLLVGCGPRADWDRSAFRKALTAAMSALARGRFQTAVSYLGIPGPAGADDLLVAKTTAALWHDATYRYEQNRQAGHPPESHLKHLGVAIADPANLAAAQLGISHGDAIGSACHLTRDLCNLPPNICTPGYLAEFATDLASKHPQVEANILEEREMRELGMGAILAVTAGSAEPAKLIQLTYRGSSPDEKPIVLVGKGVTFDSGGISLKSPERLDELKYDMTGAAVVLGVMSAAIRLQLPLNLVVLAPCCENLPSGSATRPGDVITTLSGQTVEILNTDAEGRLILCDALSYADQFEPAALIDVATLTGACMIALGSYRSGLMSNSDELASQLLSAGEAADDRAWRLPLDPEYLEGLQSNFADIANFDGQKAGAVKAGGFLSKFVGTHPWAHLDVAGPSFRSEKPKGSTGRPVPLLVQFLLDRTPNIPEAGRETRS